MNQFKSFISKRLLIRPTFEQDAKLIFQLMNTPKFIKYIGDRKISSINDAKNYIKVKMLAQLYLMGYSSYTLINKSNGDKIGICGLYNRAGVDGIDIGFGILPHFERLGYAFESSSRLIKGAFEELEIEEIKAITNQGNISSKNLLKKLGFKLIGKTILPDEKDELLLFEIKKLE
ncbi:MAG: GNAT family N-acetyltransferase [Bacteroidetes bacterium MED-G20]|nr:MAG: GNAT family N-acetyltransferase [Bacteroidetes bacterium MED-G20]